MRIDTAKKIWDAFQARYPSLTVKQYKADTNKMLERVLTDNGNEFGRRAFGDLLPAGVLQSQIRSGRPQTNGHVERLHRTILEECWRPAFARFLQVRLSGLRRHLKTYLHDYNFEREHHGRITAGRRPADLVYGARKMEPR